MTTAYQQFIKGVVFECAKYMAKYGCGADQAIADWEGDGPTGSWGLSEPDKINVRAHLEAHLEAEPACAHEFWGTDEAGTSRCLHCGTDGSA